MDNLGVVAVQVLQPFEDLDAELLDDAKLHHADTL